jgi:hypothetical protein
MRKSRLTPCPLSVLIQPAADEPAAFLKLSALMLPMCGEHAPNHELETRPLRLQFGTPKLFSARWFVGRSKIGAIAGVLLQDNRDAV